MVAGAAVYMATVHCCGFPTLGNMGGWGGGEGRGVRGRVLANCQFDAICCLASSSSVLLKLTCSSIDSNTRSTYTCAHPTHATQTTSQSMTTERRMLSSHIQRLCIIPSTSHNHVTATINAGLHSLQVWANAAHHKGGDLTADEKWGLGTSLIASLGDPVAAQRVHKETNNYYRLVRVLEVVLHTGRTLAEFEAKSDAPLDYDFRFVHCVAIH